MPTVHPCRFRAGCVQVRQTDASIDQSDNGTAAALASLLERLGGVWEGGQVELARALGISRPRVQRLLDVATRQQLVKVDAKRGRATRVTLTRPRLVAV